MAIINIKHALLAVLALSSLSLSSSVVDANDIDVVRRTTNSRGIRGSTTAAAATTASAIISSGDRVRNLVLKNAKTSDKNKKKTSDKKNKKTGGSITKTPTPVINTGGIIENPILNTDTISSATDVLTGTSSTG